MRSISPFQNGAADMARTFKQLANKRQVEFEADEDPTDEPSTREAE